MIEGGQGMPLLQDNGAAMARDSGPNEQPAIWSQIADGGL